MSGTRTAYHARWVLPIASAPIAHGVVVVDGRRIAWVGHESEWRAPRDGDERSAHRDVNHDVQLGECVLMPGLVNAHSHLELTAMRGLLEGLAFPTWLKTLMLVRRDLLDAGALRDSAVSGVQEGLRNGITTFADTADSDAPLAAMRACGVRGIGYLETFGPDPVQRTDSLRVLAARADASRALDTDLVATGISPHAPYTVSDALFSGVAEFALASRLPVAVHVAESVAETQLVRDASGPFADALRARGITVNARARSSIAMLEQTGLLAARPLLIHAIQVDDADLALIAASGATIVHCPISNVKLAHGIAPLARMMHAGIPTGLGTDSVASNDRMDILGEARQATLFAALLSGEPDSLAAHEALRLATQGGAHALGLHDRIGTLEPGKDADLCAFPLDGHDVGPVHDPAVTLVHVLAGAVRARLVTVAGRELVRDGVVLDADPHVAGRMTALGERLRDWRRTHPG